jgi:hypothetical protein
MHVPCGLQSDRAALLSGESQRLVRAHFAVRAVETQRHAEFGQQFAAAVRIDHLDVVTGGVVAQFPQALDMPEQAWRRGMLGVFHRRMGTRPARFYKRPVLAAARLRASITWGAGNGR